MKSKTQRSHSFHQEKDIVAARTIPGGLHDLNDGAIEWSYSGLIAYGCHSSIIILSAHSLEILQSIYSHRECVTQVSWKPLENISIQKGRSDALTLLSGDADGSLFLTNVQSLTTVASAFKLGGEVKQIKWVTFPYQRGAFAVVLIHPDTIILFSENLLVCWRFRYQCEVNSFCFTSVDSSLIALNVSKFIHIFDDFSLKQPLLSKGKKLFISDNSAYLQQEMSPVPSNLHVSDSNLSSSPSFISSASNMLRNTQGKGEASSTEFSLSNKEDILKCAFLPFFPPQMYIVTKRTIIVYNIESEQTIATLKLAHDILNFVPCLFADAYIIIHQNNFCVYVSEKTYRSKTRTSKSIGECLYVTQNESETSKTLTSYKYFKMASIEPIRFGRQTKISYITMNPCNESEYACITKKGQLLFYQLPFHNIKSKLSKTLLPLNGIKKFIKQYDIFNSSTLCPSNAHVEVRLVQRAIVYTLSGTISCIRVSPSTNNKTNRNFRLYAALGLQDGCIQIYYLPFGILRRNISVFNSPINHIEWLSITTLIAATNHGFTSKFDISVIDIQTGIIMQMNLNNRLSDSIKAIKASDSRHLFFIHFESGLLQLWDSEQMKCLHTLSSNNFPVLGVVIHFVIKDWKMDDISFSQDNLDVFGKSDEIDELFDYDQSLQVKIKESLYIIDTRLALRETVVENGQIKELSLLQNELSVNGVNSMSCKGSIVMMCDTDSNIVVYNAHKSSCQMYQKKGLPIRRILFSPSLGNPLVAVILQDSFQVWNSANFTVVFDSNRHNHLGIADIDWISSSYIIAVFNNGSFRIIDITSPPSTLNENHLYHKSTFLPFFLSNDNYLSLKTILIISPPPPPPLAGTPNPAIFSCLCIEEIPTTDMNAIKNQYTQFINEFTGFYHDCPTVISRALFVSSVLGEECDINFWRIASHFINHYSNISSNPYDIEPAYNYLCDADTLKLIYQWHSIHEKNTTEYNPTKTAIDYTTSWLIYLKEYMHATELLITSPSDSRHCYTNILKAVAIDAIVQNDNLNSSNIRLASSRLMSIDKVTESIEMMSLISNNLDVVTHLLGNNCIYMAIIIAKITLAETELNNFVNLLDKKYRSTLKSDMYLNNYILILISLNRFDLAIKLLFEIGRVDLAYFLLMSIRESGLEYQNLDEEFLKCLNDTFDSFLKSLHFTSPLIALKTVFED